MQSLATNSRPSITITSNLVETHQHRNQLAKANLSPPKKEKARESLLPTAMPMQPISIQVTRPIIVMQLLAKTSTLTSQGSLQATSIAENTRLKSRHRMKCGMNNPSNLRSSRTSQVKLAKLNTRSLCINLSSLQIATILKTKDTKSCQMAQLHGPNCTPKIVRFPDTRKNE